MEAFKFNTMLAALMEFNNYLVKVRATPVARTASWSEAVRALLLMMAPTTPHLSEELWRRLGGTESVHLQSWPKWDEGLAADATITLVVQINGKLRDRMETPAGISEDQARALALANPRLAKYLEDKQIVKVIFAEGRLLNIVVR